MFEDFENRSGFWKDLGSNFTINYSGSKPSFLSSGEMWQSMDGATTQTLAAWEDGWDLTNNPDGTMTANPKYTSGLLSQTLVRVPVGPSSPNSPPTGGMGGVVVTGYGAETKRFASSISMPTGGTVMSKSFKDYYNNYEAGIRDVDEQPFKELLISGVEDSQYSWSSGQGGSRLDLHNNHLSKCGNLEFVVNPGWTMEIYIKTGNADYFNDNLSDSAKNLDTLDTSGMTDGDSKLYVLMEGGDKLSMDICDDYSSTAQFYITSKGVSIDDGSPADFNDWAIVDIQNIKYDDGSGGGNGGGNGDDDPNDCASENKSVNADDTCGDCIAGYIDDGTGVCISDGSEPVSETPWILYGGIAAVALVFFLKK